MMGEPHDPEAERTTLGSMFFDPSALHQVASIVTAEDFYRPAYRLVFEAMQSLSLKGEPIEVQTVAERVRALGAFDVLGGWPVLSAISDAIPPSGDFARYARRVKEMAIRRRLIALSERMNALAKDDAKTLQQVLETSDRELFEVSRGLSSDADLPNYKTQLIKTYEGMIVRAKSPGEISGKRTGFIDLDRQIGGMRGGQLIVIAGRPGMAKSALASQIVLNIARLEKQAGALFSLEMRASEIIERHLALESQVNLARISTGRNLDAKDWDSLATGAASLDFIAQHAPIRIFDKASVTTAFVRAKCRQIRQTDGSLGVAAIDYAQILDSDVDNNRQSREREVSRITRACKQLAMEMDVPVLLLSQLNREVEHRENKRPILSDLKDSGSVEADADIVIGLYRDDYYNANSPDAGIAEAVILKNRNGRTGTLGLAFIKEQTRFADLAHGTVFGEARKSQQSSVPTNQRTRYSGGRRPEDH